MIGTRFVIIYTQQYFLLNLESTSMYVYLPTVAMLFLTPLLGNIIAGKISKKCKKVEFKETFFRYFTIINIILYLFIYFDNLEFYIIMAILYVIGAILGFIYVKKDLKNYIKIMETGTSEKEDFTKGEKLDIKEFKLGRLNGESIREFLKNNHLQEENYILAQKIPTIQESMISSIYALSNYTYYIIYFDDKKLYFFELSKMKKIIKSGFSVNLSDIKIIKLKKRLIIYKIRIECKDGSIINMQIVKKVSRLFLQKKYSEKLYQKLLELKNKEERSSK